jgi:hypothetical protein
MLLAPTVGAPVIASSIDDAISDVPAAVGAGEVATGWSRDRVLRKLGALAVAKTSGNAPIGGTVVFRNLGDTADEMSATVDANGNRTAVSQGP